MHAKPLIIILSAISLLVCPEVIAQTSCLNTLREARELYEEGLIDEIPDLLSGCMESGFTRRQRVEAYKLIILAYLFDDDQFAAEKTMDEFLRKFPEYEVMPNDPVEFVYLLESYKTSAAYTLNLTFGPLFSNQRIQTVYTTQDFMNADISTNTGSGFHIGLGISRNIWKSISGTVEVIYSIHNYTTTETAYVEFSNGSIEQARLESREKITKFDIPISAGYSFGSGNLNYTLKAGAIFSIISDASLTVNRSQRDIELSIEEKDLSGHRKSMYYGAFAGITFEYKIPRGFLVLDLRYNAGLNNIVVGEDRYDDPDLYSRGLYVDDDFLVDYLSVGIGYHFSIYQSKKSRY